MKTTLRFEDTHGLSLKSFSADGYIPVPRVGELFYVDGYQLKVAKVSHEYTNERVTIRVRGEYP